MRFNSDTERAINIDDIAAQCKAAIMKAKAKEQQEFDITVEQIANVLFDIKWENDVLIAA